MSGGKPLVASAARGAAVSAADVGRVGEVRGCARTSAGGTRGTSIGGTAACAERRRASGEGGGGGGGGAVERGTTVRRSLLQCRIAGLAC